MYAVIEMQTNDGATAVVPPVTKATIEEARQVYHLAASAAAVSAVDIHTVVLLNAEGQDVEKVICYKHPKAEE